MATRTSTRSAPVGSEQLDAIMRAAEVMVSVVAESALSVDDVVSAPQLRILVLTANRGPITVGTVANALGVHASNATRLVDRLVGRGLVDRRDAPQDRRTVILSLTPKGHDLVESVMAHRRAALARVLDHMSSTERAGLATALDAFAAAAAHERPEDRFWPRLMPH
jgi:DNA-binding MarR family transcriptional regulator